jgi:hypothetical protein
VIALIGTDADIPPIGAFLKFTRLSVIEAFRSPSERLHICSSGMRNWSRCVWLTSLGYANSSKNRGRLSLPWMGYNQM